MKTTLSSVKQNNKCTSHLLFGIRKDQRKTVDDEVRRLRKRRNFDDSTKRENK